MSTVESTDLHAANPASSLLARRPGHGPMSTLVRQARSGGWSRIPDDRAAWRSSAIGELIVGHELAQLPPDWQVLHSVPTSTLGGHIDHLVIGPGGVFVLSTRHHAGQEIAVGTEVVWLDACAVGGYQRAATKRAVRVRRVAAGILTDGAAVQPLLVFVGATTLTRVGVQSVPSVDQRELVHFLERQPAVLSAAAVATLVARLSRPETWGAPARAVVEADPTAAFLALDESSGEAAADLSSGEAAPDRYRGGPALDASARPARVRRTRPPGVATHLAHASVALLATLVVLPMGVAVVVNALGANWVGLIRP